MNQDQIAGQWHQIKGKVKQRWAEIADDEVDLLKGKQEEFVGKIQEHYGITEEEAKKEIKEFISSL